MQSFDAVQTATFSDYPGGRQDLIFAGSGNLSWTPDQTTTLSAGVRFIQQLSSHPTSTGTASICCSTPAQHEIQLRGGARLGMGLG